MMASKYHEQKKKCNLLDTKQMELNKINENMQIEINQLKGEIENLKNKN